MIQTIQRESRVSGEGEGVDGERGEDLGRFLVSRGWAAGRGGELGEAFRDEED